MVLTHIARSLLVFPSAAFATVACFTVAFYTAMSAGRAEWSEVTPIFVHCSGGGSDRVFYGRATSAKILWDPQLFLSITLGFGRFSYAEAKALDFAWDLIVGSGGQAVVAAVVYPLFRRVVLAHMEYRPVPITTYTRIAFHGVTLASSWALLGDVFTSGFGPILWSPWHWRWRIRTATHTPHYQPRPSLAKTDRLLWAGFIYAFLYLLSFAKLLSLITGYQVIATALVTAEDQQDTGYVGATTAVYASLVVVNGTRIGFQDHHGVGEADINYKALLACKK